MVEIIRDEDGDIIEVRMGLIDKLLGNDVKVSRGAYTITEHGVFGFGYSKRVIRDHRTSRHKVKVEIKKAQRGNLKLASSYTIA